MPTLIPEAPSPAFVMTADGLRLATYDVGDHGAPVVLAVHGFASSADANWFATGWVRELVRAGRRVLAIDQRGHGASDKPHDPGAYSMEHLVADVHAVLETYLLDEVSLVGYSLGARVGWHASLGSEHSIVRAVLGGIPDGRPLTRFRIAEARAHVEDGAPLEDRLTRAYVDMAARNPANDVMALIALVEGLQDGLQPDPDRPPTQPVLFATGSEDGILEASKRLAASTPHGEFFEIPGRNHFNAPTARTFRDRALEFLDRPLRTSAAVPTRPEGAHEPVDAWTAGLAALAFAGPSMQDPRDLATRLQECWPLWVACLADAADAAEVAEVAEVADRL